ncbi:MAG: CBS domain-containing protein, partial [Candidatus Dadabacteria bacterium]
NYAKLSEPVSKIMHTDVITISPDTTLDEMIDLFIDEKIGAVPVVDPESNHLEGIVSYIDILKAVRELAEQEN